MTRYSRRIKMPNYIQPNAANPAVNPAVTVQPHAAGATNGNPLQILAPIPRHVEKLSIKDDPHGTYLAGRSGN